MGNSNSILDVDSHPSGIRSITRKRKYESIVETKDGKRKIVRKTESTIYYGYWRCVRFYKSTCYYSDKTQSKRCYCNLQSEKRPKIDGQPKTIEAKSRDDKEQLPVLENTDECTICRETYCSTDDKSLLPCTHCFHRDCVDRWLSEYETCPLCMRDALNELSV